MEALGAVASCITLLEVSLKTLGFVRQISEVQEDFANLREEVGAPRGTIIVGTSLRNKLQDHYDQYSYPGLAISIGSFSSQSILPKGS